MYENLIKLKSVLNYNQKKNLIFITLLMFLTIPSEPAVLKPMLPVTIAPSTWITAILFFN